jgi:capsular exopolysaccharide synthesis family protein
VPFRDFIGILRMRWMIVVGCVLLVVAGMAVMDLRTTPVYQAHARIFLASSGTGYALRDTDLQTYVELLGSPVVQDPLRTQLGLPPNASIDVSGSVTQNSPIMDITARATSAKLAADIANGVGPRLAAIGGEYAPLLKSQGQTVTAIAITPAVPPGRPISPNLPRDLSLAAVIGLALGLGLMLLRHAADTKLHSESELAAFSDKPVLGRLVKIKDASKNPLPVATEPHGVATEQYRKLFTNLQFVDVATNGRHSFQITSPMPGEGKTITIVNLALAAVTTGANVLIVDCDLRHPSVAKTLGLEGGVGLTTVLLGRARLPHVIQPWGNVPLAVLPAGEIPPNPSQLIASQAMARVFDRLLDAYDLVLVDSPPVNPVTDPILINRLVGGLVMLTSLGQTRKHDLQNALKSLSTAGIEPVGFITNLVNPQSLRRYGYYYGDGEQRQQTSRHLSREHPTQPIVRSPEVDPVTRAEPPDRAWQPTSASAPRHGDPNRTAR